MGDRKRRLSRAIDVLALRVEHGALLAATDPAALLESAGDRIAALESRLAEVEQERDEARTRIRKLEEALRALRDADRDRALTIVSKQKTFAADTRYWRARCTAYALIGPTSATDGDSDAQGDR